MNQKTFSSVWDAIENTAAEAENMKLRSSTEAARRLGVTQPRISDLLRGKINLFGLDSLVNMAAAAGLHVELHLRELDPA